MLASAGGPVAILDIDVHHGNGTQGIFYASGDVLTVSVHADPSDYFPFYAGYADETGAGAGAGLNRNLPLPPGSGDGPWLAAVEAGLAAIAALKPRGLVVALGLDAAADDPIGVLTVTQAASPPRPSDRAGRAAHRARPGGRLPLPGPAGEPDGLPGGVRRGR